MKQVPAWAKALQDALLDAQLSRATFAMKVGVHIRTANKWLRGEDHPSANRAREIVRVLGGRVDLARLAPHADARRRVLDTSREVQRLLKGMRHVAEGRLRIYIMDTESARRPTWRDACTLAEVTLLLARSLAERNGSAPK